MPGGRLHWPVKSGYFDSSKASAGIEAKATAAVTASAPIQFRESKVSLPVFGDLRRPPARKVLHIWKEFNRPKIRSPPTRSVPSPPGRLAAFCLRTARRQRHIMPVERGAMPHSVQTLLGPN